MELPQETTTIRRLAAKCGVSKTTMALALKNSPLVSPTTRARLQLEATRMGYKTDANVSKLMRYLSQRKQQRSLCNLGWINSSPDEDEWRTTPWRKGLLQGARSRAEELGYAIDEIWIREPHFRLARLRSIMRARGIEGILLPPLLNEVPTLHEHLPWDDIHAIVINDPFELSKLNRVDCNYAHNIQLAMLETLKLGYTRPALATSHYHDWRSNFAFSGQFVADHGHIIPRHRLRPYWREKQLVPEDFLDWFRIEKPDVLLVTNNEWREDLQKMNLRVPEDIGIVHLNLEDDVRSWAGVDSCSRLVGSSAVDLVTAHLARDEKGIPLYVKEIQIRGEWQVGETIRLLA